MLENIEKHLFSLKLEENSTEAETTLKIEINEEEFETSYSVGDYLDLDFTIYLNTYDDETLIEQAALTFSDVEIFIYPSEYPALIEQVSENYVLESSGTYYMQITYEGAQDYLTVFSVVSQSEYILYYAIVAVVIILAVGVGILVRNKKAGKGIFAKKSKKDEEILAKYKDELLSYEKMDEDTSKAEDKTDTETDANEETTTTETSEPSTDTEENN